jgi:abortive infection bacteriophage resistance protein
MAKYEKPHLPYPDQLALLKSRGLACADDAHAIRVLRAAGYYRLSAYIYPFRELLTETDERTSPYHFRSDKIRQGTTFEQIEALWRFDRALRMVWLDGLETIEVGIRTQVANTIGKHHTFGHLEREALDEAACEEPGKDAGDAFTTWCARYEELRKNAMAEDFMRHNTFKYGGELPIWIAVEFLDFGAIARLFNLLRREDQNEIARGLEIRNGKLLARILVNLNYIRNAAAHHSRLWNRTLTYQPPKIPPAVVPSTLAHLADLSVRDKTYIPLAITAHLTDQLDPATNWPSRVRTLVRKFPNLAGVSPVGDMGFPEGWESLALWKHY